VTSFRVVRRTTRWRGDYLSVDDVEVEGPDGRKLVRAVVRHPGAVVVVAVGTPPDHVVMLRQFRTAAERELLEVVAGKRDVPGEAPEATARRELEEELGVRAGRVVKLCEFYNSPGFCDEYSYLYCALDLEPLDELHPVTEEEAAMTQEVVALADIDRLVADGTIADAKSIIGLHLARRLLDAERSAPPG
jgi:ADP-ribose diphosphatase